MNLLIWLLSALLMGVIMNWISPKINYQYGVKSQLFVIVGNMASWYFIYEKYGASNLSNLNIILLAIIFSILWAIIVIDYKYYEIPNEYNLALLIAGVVFLMNNWDRATSILLAGVIAFVFYYFIMVITRGNLGGGDVKLAGNLGLICSNWMIVMQFVTTTFIFGAFISLFLLLFRFKKKTDKIAFGPYICLAFIFVFVG